MPLRPTYDPNRLDEAGWGIIMMKETASVSPDMLLDALGPLLKYRQAQAQERFKLLEARPGETAQAFLSRHHLRPGAVDPQRFPYYLLIVAPPDEVSYEFQAELSLSYAVGRLWLEEPGDFHRYATSLVESEHGEPSGDGQVAFFAPSIPDDYASQFISGAFMRTIVERSAREFTRWQMHWISQEQATKDTLGRLLGEHPPDLLVTGGPGAGFPPGHPRQLSDQGAIVCQDWPGPKAQTNELPPEFYFAAGDIHPQADFGGLISFHFSDYSLGTPARSAAQAALFDEAPLLAEKAFVARLPQRLLSHPPRGALAVIGFVDKVWLTAIPGLKVPPTNTVAIFESSLRRLLQGFPLGFALEYVRQNVVELSSHLEMLTTEAQFGKQVSNDDLVATWAALSTSRNLAILGDPAVRLPGAGRPPTTMAY